MATPAEETPLPTIVEVGDDDFESIVVEGSRDRPVLVDFWADWCGPCHMLSPILERAAEAGGGRFLLAKLDVDANPVTARRFQVMSIPTVIAFVDGEPVDGFIGAIPQTALDEFLARALPGEAADGVDDATAAEATGDLDTAERAYREVLASRPEDRAARLGLARVLAARGAAEEAREALRPLLPDPEAARIEARLEVQSWRSLHGDDPLDAAKRVAGEGRWTEAMDAFLGAIQHAPDRRDEARGAALTVFEVLGDDDPITREYRAKLAAALF